MKKATVYRKVGWFLLIFFGLCVIVTICMPPKFQRFLSNSGRGLFPSLFGIVPSAITPRQIDYPESKTITMRTIDDLVNRMRDNNKSKVYFEILPEPDIAEAEKEIFELIVSENSKKALFDKLSKMQVAMESFAVNLANKEVPEDFYNNPNNYPDLATYLLKYVYEDFKMSLLAYIYYTVYDQNFKSNFSATAQKAAKRVMEILIRPGEVKPTSGNK